MRMAYLIIDIFTKRKEKKAYLNVGMVKNCWIIAFM